MRNAVLVNPKVVKVEELKAIGTTVVTLKGIDEIVELNTGENVGTMFERLAREAGATPYEDVVEILRGGLVRLSDDVEQMRKEKAFSAFIVKEVVYQIDGLLSEIDEF